MPAASPARRRRLMPVLPLALSVVYGCTDAPSPVEPRAFPTSPHALVGPTVIVTNTDDAGAGSLRQAILDAPTGATIQFDAAIAGATIVLSTGHVEIDKALTIEGPVPAGMTISGGLTSRVFLVVSTGDAVLRNLAIINGRDKFGGGMVVEGRAMLDHSLVANNEAEEVSGGGILLRNTGALVLVNSTVSGNTTPGAGGGINSSGELSIRNSTIAHNTAADGGGVFASTGSLTSRNSIIASNVATLALANCVIKAGVTAIFAGRTISDDESCGTDPANIIGDPRLAPLASNGGPTMTHALRFGQAVDAGTVCTEITDQRYVARNQGPACDLGAFEFTDYGTITVTLNPNVAVNARTGVATVTGTISCSESTSVVLDVRMSQTQKTTGRFTTIIEALNGVSVPACGQATSSWSTTLTPGTGKFAPGSATATASTSILVGGFVPASVTAPLKLFQVK